MLCLFCLFHDLMIRFILLHGERLVSRALAGGGGTWPKPMPARVTQEDTAHRFTRQRVFFTNPLRSGELGKSSQNETA